MQPVRTSGITVNHYGTYVLRWTETNGTCSYSPADITINFYENPTPASAGTAPIPVCNALTATLAGTAHTYLADGSTHVGSTTAWSVITKPLPEVQ